MWRKIILNIGLLALVLVCMSFALSNVLIKGRPLWVYLNSSLVLKGGQAYEMSRELDQVGTAPDRYFVFGSSHAYRGYDPQVFNRYHIPVFNAGSSGQTLNCSYALMQYYVHKINRVILDVYPASFVKPTGEAQLILLQSCPKFDLALKLFALKRNIHTVNNLLYRVLRIKNGAMYADEGYMGKGYVASDEVMQKETYIPEPVRKYDEGQFDLLKDIIGFCRIHHIELSLVSHPLPQPTERNGDYLVFKQRVSEICKTNGVAFYDYTYEYNLDNTYFKDMNHLNAKGVAFFDTLFIRQKFKTEN